MRIFSSLLCLTILAGVACRTPLQGEQLRGRFSQFSTPSEHHEMYASAVLYDPSDRPLVISSLRQCLRSGVGVPSSPYSDVRIPRRDDWPPERDRDFWALVLAQHTGQPFHLHRWQSLAERDARIQEILR